MWTYAATGGISALFNEPGILDFVRMGSFLDSVRWFDLVPSNLDGMPTLITAGTGTYASWSDGGSGNGGMDWVVAAATRDGKSLIAYVPDAHAGSITVNMTAMSATARARWFDPTNANYTLIGNFPNTGTQVFTSPAANSAGAHDWVLNLDRADSIFADGFGG